MTDFANLPSDITPSQLVDLILEALKNETVPAGVTAEKLVVHVDNEAWTFGFEGNKIVGSAGSVSGAPLQVSLSAEDVRAFAAGSVRDALKAKHGESAAAIDPKQISQLFALTNKADQIKAFSGDLQLIIEEPTGNRKVTLTFGGGAPNLAAPTTTITLTLEDFLAMTSGELNPQTAFFMGKLRLDGDMNLAMAVAALAMG